MKVSVVVTAVLVAVGIAMGFLVGRSTGSGGGSNGEGSNAERAGAGSGSMGRGGDASGGRLGPDGKPRQRATSAIRQVARKLDYSPMAMMDFDGMFSAYEEIRWMSPEEIQSALTELEVSDANQQTKMMLSMMLINLWAKKDGKSAVEFAMNSKNGKHQVTKMMAVNGGLMAWVKSDPDGAWEWYEGNKEEVSKGGMMGNSITGIMYAALAQRDMGTAFERMESLGKQEKQQALSMIGMQSVMYAEKRDEFVHHLQSLDDTKLRDESLRSMVTMWAYQDPQSAITFIESREWGDDVRGQMVSQVTSSWSNSDAESALKWRMNNVGENEDRSEAIANPFAQWMVQDSESARSWLQNQPAELRTDSLYQSTANQLQWNSNFQEAAQWAEQIESSHIRLQTYRNLYQQWNGSDEEEAATWLSGIDAESREAIQNSSVPGVIQPAELIETEAVPE